MKFDAQTIALLGEGSYPSILFESVSKLNESKAETNVGNQLILDTLTKTSKSLTPMLELHSFFTNAQEIAGNDKTIGDIIKFMDKQFKGGDLNYLINLAKENHMQTNAKNGFPFPEETLNEIKSLFGKPAQVIEKLIVDGMFDTLEGEIYTEIKKAIGLKPSKNNVDNSEHKKIFDKFQALNESEHLVKYSPIGISYRDIEDNLILLVENTSIVVKDEVLSEIKLENLPKEESRIMGALTSLSKNYKDDSIGLSQRWDLDIKVDKNGDVFLNEPNTTIPKQIKIEKDDLRGLLSETIEHYEKLLVKPKGYNKANYQLDADNLVVLVENHSRLIKMDELISFRNLQSDSFVTIPANTEQAPKILSSNIAIKEQPQSYIQLNSYIEQIIQHNIGDMFKEPIANEQKFIAEKFNKIAELVEEQTKMENLLIDVREMKSISQLGSESFAITTKQENDLVAKLSDNINKQANYRLRHKMY